MNTIFILLFSLTIVISAAVFILLVKFIRSQKNAERVREAFDNVAAELNLDIVQSDQAGNSMLGFDPVSSRLLFLEINGFEQNGHLVDLEKVKNISVKTTYRNTAPGRNRNPVDISMITLQLSYKNGAAPLQLPFYKRTIDSAADVYNRKELARTWQSLLTTAVVKEENPQVNRITFIGSMSKTRVLIHGQYTLDQLN